jgi:hypothetical protein
MRRNITWYTPENAPSANLAVIPVQAEVWRSGIPESSKIKGLLDPRLLGDSKNVRLWMRTTYIAFYPRGDLA